MNLRRTIGAASGMALLLGIVVATPAAANHLACGQVLHGSATLDSDLFCRTGDGLVLDGSNLTLNLNGHTIRGELETRSVTQPGATGDDGVVDHPYTVRYARGQFAGVRVHGTNIIVTGPGTVKNFAAGVVVEGGGSNTVTGLLADGNLGPPGTDDLGDGIMIRDSNGNTVAANTVRDNGPYDGIVLLGNTERNIIQGNTVVDNKQPEICPNFDVFRFTVSGGNVIALFCGPSHPVRKPFTYINEENHGIKIEGQGTTSAHHNLVAENVVTGSGNAGIFVPSQCADFEQAGGQCPGDANHDNVIRNNQVNANGFGYPTGHPSFRVFEGLNNGGSGIVLLIGGPKPPFRHVITGNTVNDNAENGITVLPHRAGNGSTMSSFSANTALRNNANPVPGGFAAYNGFDGNVVNPCDSNFWARNNNFGSSLADIHGPVPPNNLTNQPCVGPQLPTASSQAAVAAEQPQDDATTMLSLSRHKANAPAPTSS